MRLPETRSGARHDALGVEPRETLKPDTIEALADALAAVNRAGAVVVPWGGGTRQELGAPPVDADVVIESSGLVGIVEWAPENLTVTVSAGTTIGRLQASLAEAGQFLPVNPALPDRATVGGTLATGAGGSLRGRFGPVRDQVIGTVVVRADGRVLRCGGRVVKNVAGYDMNKLFVGSLGTLVVIAQATFKVAPLPEQQATLLATLEAAEDAWIAARALRRSSLDPMAIEILSPNARQGLSSTLDGDGWLLAARFGGVTSAVERSLREAKTLVGANAAATWTIGGQRCAGPAPWSELQSASAAAPAIVRIGLRPGDAEGVCTALCEILPGAQLRVWPETATVEIALSTVSAAVDDIGRIRALLAPRMANVVVERAPLSVRQQLGADGIWGTPGPDIDVMRRLKAMFDPASKLNPGRYVGGI